MAIWIKAMLATVTLILPGGFLCLFLYFAGRMLWKGWEDAARRSNGARVDVMDVLRAVHVRDIVREARSAF